MRINNWILKVSQALILFANLTLWAQDQCKPIGWATQGSGVTGGGSATPTVVTTYAALKSAIENTSVKVIHISGSITFPANGRINIQDQTGKSILGLLGSKLTSVDLTADGSGIFYVKRCSNLIFRNIIFVGPGAYDTDGNDNMTIDNCTNIWVDHCEFHDGMDGNLDIKTASDLISVTWCTFSYEKAPIPGGSGGAPDHRYSNLFGSSDGATGDRGKLRITMQYCWWGSGCRERMPRVRFGKVHMVNNYFSSSVANQGIRAGFEADILAESNYFIAGYPKPIDEFEGNYTAILSKNNINASNLTKGTAFTPPYTLTITNAANIVTPITNCAGAKLSNPTACSACSSNQQNNAPIVTLTAPANNATFTAPATLNISANASDSDGSISQVQFYNGTTLLGTDNTSPYSFSWTNVTVGTYTITAKATDNLGATNTSNAITVVVRNATSNNILPTVIITSPTNNATFIAPASVNFSATATDADGSITKVEFYNGTTLLSTITSSPYTYNWVNVPVGTYNITAKATDNTGGVTTSTIITIVVSQSTNAPATLTKKGSGSANQTITLGQPIVDFSYTWTNANTVTVTGLPTGVFATVNTNTMTVSITGTPTVTGSFDFNINTVGGNPNTNKSGNITVNVVTDVVDFESISNIQVYPNPFTNTFTFTGQGNYNYSLQNLLGDVVNEGTITNTLTLGENLKNGIYILKLTQNKYNRSFKLTKN